MNVVERICWKPRSAINLAESPLCSQASPPCYILPDRGSAENKSLSVGAGLCSNQSRIKNILALVTSADPLFTIHKNGSTLRLSNGLNSIKVFQCLGTFCQYSYHLLVVFLKFCLLKSRKQVKISKR